MGYIYNFTVLQSIYNKGEFADFRNKYFKVALDKFENSLGVQVSSENKLIKIKKDIANTNEYKKKVIALTN